MSSTDLTTPSGNQRPTRPDGSPIVDDRTSGPRYEPFRWLVEECPDELRGLSSAALADALTRGLRSVGNSLREECPDELRGLSSAALADALTRGLRSGGPVGSGHMSSPLREFPSPSPSSLGGHWEIGVDSVTGDPLGGVKVSGRVKTGYRTLREIREEKLQKGNSHA